MPSRIVVSAPPRRKKREPAMPAAKLDRTPEAIAAADARVKKWLEHQLAYARGDVKTWVVGDE